MLKLDGHSHGWLKICKLVQFFNIMTHSREKNYKNYNYRVIKLQTLQLQMMLQIFGQRKCVAMICQDSCKLNTNFRFILTFARLAF